MTGSATPPPLGGRPAPASGETEHRLEVLHPVLVTVAAVVAAGLVTVTAHTGAELLAAAVALAGLVLVWGWPGALSLPSPRGSATVLLLGTAALVLSVVLTTATPYLRFLPAALAGGVLACFVHQLARRDGRPRLVESVAATVTGLAVVASGACLVALPRIEDGSILVTAAMAAIAVSAVVDLLGRIRALVAWALPLGMLLGGAAAVAIGHRAGLAWEPLALLGVSSAGVSHTVRRVLGALPTLAGARPQLVSGATSVLQCGVLAVVVQRIFFP